MNSTGLLKGTKNKAEGSLYETKAVVIIAIIKKVMVVRFQKVFQSMYFFMLKVMCSTFFRTIITYMNPAIANPAFTKLEYSMAKLKGNRMKRTKNSESK